MAHKHSVYDSDTHLRINPTTRTFAIEGFTKNTIVQHDHNSERFTFELPRVIEGHDMLECNSVQVHYLNIDANTQETSSGVFVVTDLQESPEDENIAIFSWLISSNATKYVGSLNFCIRFACISEENTVDYAWNTAVNTTMRVTDGINNAEIIIQEYADVLEQWKQDITSNIYDFLPEHLQFGSEGVQTVEILPTTELTLAVDDDGGLADPISQAMLTPLNLQEGVEYKVKFNNDTFNCVAYILNMVEDNYMFLGNSKMFGGEDTEEPFAIVNIPMGTIFAYFGVLETATLSISTETEKIKKLDNKYIDAEWMATKSKKEELLYEDTITFNSAGSKTFLTPLFEIVEGKIYNVSFDGKIYQCCGTKATSNDGKTYHMLGNASMIHLDIYGNEPAGLDTGEPFVFNNIMQGTIAGLTSIFTTFVSASVDISVIKVDEKFNQLPTKYLPEHLQFGTTKEYGEIMSEREVVFSEEGMGCPTDDSGEVPYNIPQLTEGFTYTVVWNGVTYETLCASMENMLALGNVGMMTGGSDTGEPFVAIVAPNTETGGNVMMVMSLDGSTTVTMSLSGELETVTKLDVKYLPEPFIVELTGSGNDYTTNKTSSEILEAIRQGVQVYACVEGAGNILVNSFDNSSINFLMVSGGDLFTYTINGDIVLVDSYRIAQ